MDDVEALDRIARKETRDRVARILEVSRTAKEASWQEIYGDAHTLAGMADDATVADTARDMASRLRDERGAWVEPDDRALKEDVARLAAWYDDERRRQT